MEMIFIIAVLLAAFAGFGAGYRIGADAAGKYIFKELKRKCDE